MDIADIRSKIDEVDETLLAYFIERLRLAEEIARYKQEHQLPIPDNAREREVLQRVQERSGLYEPYANELFHTIIALSKIRQQELYSQAANIATHEPEGSLSQAAYDRLLPIILGNPDG